MWAVLTARQMREIEIYSQIEPIGWDVGVSRPPAKVPAPTSVEDKLDAVFAGFEGGG